MRGSMRPSFAFSSIAQRRAYVPFALLFGFCAAAMAQDFVSASAGVLQYFEGAVAVDGKPVEHRAAVFPSLKNDSVLTTEKGRAELLLSPSVYLRIDENSSVRMLSNSLKGTRVQLTSGTGIIDTLNAPPDCGLVIIYGESEVRFSKPGIYRIDSDVSELQAYSGESAVKHHGMTTVVDATHRYYFALEMTTDKFGDGNTDEFYDWAHNRSDVIADQNQVASAEQADDQDADPGPGIFSVPPLTGTPNYPAPWLGQSTYALSAGQFYQYQPLQTFGYGAFGNIFIVLPYLGHKPVAGKWPVSAVNVYRPSPVVNRWPSPTPGLMTHLPATAIRYPAGTSLARPPLPAIQHLSAPVVIPRAAVPHAAVIGHR